MQVYRGVPTRGLISIHHLNSYTLTFRMRRFTRMMLIMWVWTLGKHYSVDTKYDIIGSWIFGFMTKKSTLYWYGVTLNHKFTSKGSAICTTYSTLYLQRLDSEKEKLHKKTKTKALTSCINHYHYFRRKQHPSLFKPTLLHHLITFKWIISWCTIVGLDRAGCFTLLMILMMMIYSYSFFFFLRTLYVVQITKPFEVNVWFWITPFQ